MKSCPDLATAFLVSTKVIIKLSTSSWTKQRVADWKRIRHQHLEEGQSHTHYRSLCLTWAQEERSVLDTPTRFTFTAPTSMWWRSAAFFPLDNNLNPNMLWLAGRLAIVQRQWHDIDDEPRHKLRRCQCRLLARLALLGNRRIFFCTNLRVQEKRWCPETKHL